MSPLSLSHRSRFTKYAGALLILAAALVVPSGLIAQEVVVVQGTQTSDERMAMDPRAGQVTLAMISLMQRIMSALPRDVQDELYEAQQDQQEEFDPIPPDFTIRFSPTTMRMDQGKQTWMIVIGSTHVGYFGWDEEERQGVKNVATIQGLANLAERVAPFETIMQDYPKRCEPGGEPVELGAFKARFCSYEHTGAVMAGGIGLGTDVKTVGKAWIATGIPGEETIQAFYRNLDEAVQSSPGVGSYFSGLIASQLDIMEEGIPIYNAVKIDGRVASTTKLMYESTTRVTSVTVETLGDSSEMTEEAVPDDIEMVDLAALENLASGFAGGGAAAAAASGNASAPGSSDSPPEAEEQGCDCSCAAFEKFQTMSKKERKQWEQSSEGMAQAMCMAQCMSQWMKCAM
jgi:hypothetical protein